MHTMKTCCWPLGFFFACLWWCMWKLALLGVNSKVGNFEIMFLS